MKTTLFVDPNGEHERIVELGKARAAHIEKHPDATPGHFTFRGEAWEETANGYGLSLSRSIRDIPLVLRGVPIHLIELEDSIEDPQGSRRLAEGIHEVGGLYAEVDSYVAGYREMRYFCYTVKIEGYDLGAINNLYKEIRQGKSPTILWDLVAPDH